MHDNSRNWNNFRKRRNRLNRGKAGPRGPQGPPGPQGIRGLPGILCYANVYYKHATISQTITAGSDVDFNITGLKTNDTIHNDTVDNATITLCNTGIYKLDYVLTIASQNELSSPSDDTVFALVINDVINQDTVFGSGQHNSLAPYQISGSCILNITSPDSEVKLRNIGTSDVTLCRILDVTPVIGASLTIIKLPY